MRSKARTACKTSTGQDTAYSIMPSYSGTLSLSPCTACSSPEANKVLKEQFQGFHAFGNAVCWTLA